MEREALRTMFGSLDLLLPHFALRISRLTTDDRVYSKSTTQIKVASIVSARYSCPAETWPVAQFPMKNRKCLYR